MHYSETKNISSLLMDGCSSIRSNFSTSQSYAQWPNGKLCSVVWRGGGSDWVLVIELRVVNANLEYKLKFVNTHLDYREYWQHFTQPYTIVSQLCSIAWSMMHSKSNVFVAYRYIHTVHRVFSKIAHFTFISVQLPSDKHSMVYAALFMAEIIKKRNETTKQKLKLNRLGVAHRGRDRDTERERILHLNLWYGENVRFFFNYLSAGFHWDAIYLISIIALIPSNLFSHIIASRHSIIQTYPICHIQTHTHTKHSAQSSSGLERI